MKTFLPPAHTGYFPPQFEYLKTVFDIPMIVEAVKLVGIEEIPGAASNPVIMGWAKTLKVEAIYTNDDTAWCSLAQAIVATRSAMGMPFTGYQILRAKSWEAWGIGVRKGEAMLGDVLVFARPGGAHVGLYVGEDETHFYVMGGNQSNAYGFAKIEKSRCTAVRRPRYAGLPRGVRKVYIKDNSAASKNEA